MNIQWISLLSLLTSNAFTVQEKIYNNTVIKSSNNESNKDLASEYISLTQVKNQLDEECSVAVIAMQGNIKNQS